MPGQVGYQAGHESAPTTDSKLLSGRAAAIIGVSFVIAVCAGTLTYLTAGEVRCKSGRGHPRRRCGLRRRYPPPRFDHQLTGRAACALIRLIGSAVRRTWYLVAPGRRALLVPVPRATSKERSPAGDQEI
jgi:hypothetical protein